MSNRELNEKLLDVCTDSPVDLVRAEELLRQGADPLGAVTADRETTNLFDAVVEYYITDDSWDLYRITELFLRYGMDISRPEIPYDDNNVLDPLWTFAFGHGEAVLLTLRLLLDHGLPAESAAQCWGHEICNYCQLWGDLTDEDMYKTYYDYLHKLMLFASYPHVLLNDPSLRDEIWYEQNDYDVTKFREWKNYSFAVDTSRCDRGTPEVYHSVVTVIENATGKAVWKFGVCLSPEDLE